MTACRSDNTAAILMGEEMGEKRHQSISVSPFANCRWEASSKYSGFIPLCQEQNLQVFPLCSSSNTITSQEFQNKGVYHVHHNIIQIISIPEGAELLRAATQPSRNVRLLHLGRTHDEAGLASWAIAQGPADSRLEDLSYRRPAPATLSSHVPCFP